MEDETQLLLARLMEGGREDEETVQDVDLLTRLLNEDIEAVKSGTPSITRIIDADCFDTIACYLDMRQPELVRAHATLSMSAYLKAAGDEGKTRLTEFFNERISRGTYDDYIVAFCVASAIFPIVPDIVSELFMSEGFLPSLTPLMRRKWKSRKVETACLEMLNAACMHQACREAVQKYCTEWLEEIVDHDPEKAVGTMYTSDLDWQVGSVNMRKHSEQVKNLAAVVLAKIKAVQRTQQSGDMQGPRVEEATTSIEDLSTLFTTMLLQDPEHAPLNSTQNSVEGLAYASLQPTVKEALSKNTEFLKQLIKTLETAPAKSTVTYGALSILVNLTVYQPTQSEEEKKMQQLKAYANAAGKIQQNPLNNDEHVSVRCRRVFDAGVVPVLVSHSKNGSVASLSLIVSIIYSLSLTTGLRGQLAQQGAVRLLIAAWSALPTSEDKTRRTAAQALARILISTNPALVFGGNRPMPQNAAIRPLVSIVGLDPNAETRDLLPTFEALMALTNLASTDDDSRDTIARAVWPALEDVLLGSNARVTTAAVELICNLVQSAEAAAMYVQEPQASTRLHVLLALADAEDESTRSAAGGALAALTGIPEVVMGVAKRERGVEIVLGLCNEDNEDLRHRGAFVVYNMLAAEGEAGELAREKIKATKGIEALTSCAKKSRRAEVVEVTVQALKILVEDGDPA